MNDDGTGAAAPLNGVTVVSLEQAVAAPLATRHLADLGARVIKVERPVGGDFARHYDRAVGGESSYFVWLNRGKESVELDLKSPSDHALVLKMIDSADVVVQNLIPGAAERLGLDAETLRARRPDLIHCSISGYGADGPHASRKAYDLLVQCESGLLSVTGTPEHPAKVGVSVVDIATGMYAFSGVLAGLYRRERTGHGGTLEVSMLDAAAEWMMQPHYLGSYGERAFRRSGAEHASIAPYGPHRVADGVVFIGVQNNREWRTLCEQVLRRPDLVEHADFRENTDRVRSRAALTGLLESAWRHRRVDELLEELEQRGIASAQVRSAEDLATHPQLVARNRWHTVATPAGDVRALLPPWDFTGQPPGMSDVPALGQHNDLIRAEFAGSPPPSATSHEAQP